MTNSVATSSDLRDISLDLIRESPLNTRRHYDEGKLAELTESFRRSGQLTPAVVRPTDDGHFELAAGHRRNRAARRAEFGTLLCLVRPMDDATFLEVLTVENLQREDLHALDEVQGFARLMELPGYDLDGVAAKVGKSPSYVAQRLKLLDLCPEAQQMFLADRMLVGHALVVARLGTKDQKRALEVIADRWRGMPTVTSLREWVQRAVLQDLHGSPFPKDDATLHPAAGPCGSCPKRTGHQGDLLGDISVGGKTVERCLDQVCFATKLSTFLTRRFDEVSAQHPDAARVSTSWSAPADKGVLPRDGWRDAKKTDQGAVRAVVVEGADRLGKTLWITVGRKGPTSTSRPNDDREKAAREKRRRDMVRRRAIYDAVAPKLPSVLGEAELRAIIDGYLHEMTADSWRMVATALRVEPAKGKHGGRDFLTPIRAAVAEFTTQRLAVFAQQLTLVGELSAPSYSDAQPKKLLAAAKTLGVDVEAIDGALRELAKAAKAKNAPKKAKAAARPTSKKKAAIPPTKKLAGDLRRERKATSRPKETAR